MQILVATLRGARTTARGRVRCAVAISTAVSIFHSTLKIVLSRSQRCNLEEGAERQGCRSLLSIGGIICNFTPILPYIQHWGMNVDHHFFQVSKLSEDQKKGLHKKWNTFFPEFR